MLGAGDTEVQKVQKAGFLPRLSSGEGDSHPSDCQVRVSTLSCRPRELSKAAQGRRCLSVFFMEDWEFSVTSREWEYGAHVEEEKISRQKDWQLLVAAQEDHT